MDEKKYDGIDPARHIGLAHTFVQRWLRRKPRDPDYGDLLQDAMIVVSRAARPGNYDPHQGGQFSTYATKALLNHFSNEWRKRQRRRGARFYGLGGAPQMPRDHAMDRPLSRRFRNREELPAARSWSVSPELRELWRTAEKLATPKQLRALILHLREGMTHRRVAGIMGVTPQRVAQHLEKLFTKMRGDSGVNLAWSRVQ